MAKNEGTKTIFVVGGTGAQGTPIITALTKDGAYTVRVLTRDPSSSRAQKLAKLPHVELVQGKLDSDEDLRKGLKDCWGAFVNIDGFVVGQKMELFWGVRSYQLAQEAGIKFFVWGNLDYVSREANYDPQFRCGHYDAKGTVGDWILSQTRWHAERQKQEPERDTSYMSAGLFTSAPYLDMTLGLHTVMTPVTAEDGAIEWRVPLGDGAVVHIVLEDCGKFVRWQFDHAFDADGKLGRANGMNLAAATEHVSYDKLAEAFTKVTGKPARFVDVSEEEYFVQFGKLNQLKFGHDYTGMQDGDESILTWQQNFTGFWRMWQQSGGENPLIKRDYAFLDEIVPDRIKSVEEWFTKRKDLCMAVAEGRLDAVLKGHEDRQVAKEKSQM
ncbi:hypothetical protein LTR36_003330 [Oleoguttula mirabilis]|uniref:NmrA-like domain-containing protein n=1 Tax=Oleoguttula mirabilis TaxID=1507867 RepID=A0AAV9JXL5_9PEZI|nr:hypothetical protein LTR36_003330 [Oleoguttula mirabilis]